MDVHIDKSGRHEQSGSVDHFGAGSVRIAAPFNRGDRPVLDADVGRREFAGLIVPYLAVHNP